MELTKNEKLLIEAIREIENDPYLILYDTKHSYIDSIKRTKLEFAKDQHPARKISIGILTDKLKTIKRFLLKMED
mgnify:CR=1 FL=1